jgi:small subunit ribosomal protein S17
MMEQAEAAKTEQRKLRRTRVGVVASDKRDKTIQVLVEYQVEHPIYGKRIGRRSKFQVHDPENLARRGDRVQITQCRPISKTKRWRLDKILHRAQK